MIDQYPAPDLDDVCSVIACYLRQSIEVEAYLRQRQEQAEAMMWRQIPYHSIVDGSVSTSASGSS